MSDVKIKTVAELSVKQFIDELKKTTREADKFGKKTKAAMSGVKAETKKMQQSIKAATPIMAKLGIQAAIAATAFIAIGAAMRKGKEAVFGMNAEIETAEIQFATFLGSAEAAEVKVASLFEFAKTTPFETGPIIKASRQLQVFGGNVLNSDENLRLFGDAAAATSAPIDNLTFWIGRMYSMIQGGKPFGEAAMRLQELAVMTPEARTQMEELQKAGASSEEVFEVFKESIEKFGGSMEIQSKTWKGATSTFKDGVNIIIAEAFKPLFDSAKTSLLEINETLSSEEMKNSVQTFKNNLAEIPLKMIDLKISAEEWRHAFVMSLEGIQAPLTSVAGFIGGVFNVIQLVFKKFFETVGGWWNQFGETPEEVVENIKLAFKNLPLEIEFTFLNMIQFIADAFNELPNRISRFFTSIGNKLKSWWESLQNLDFEGAGNKMKDLATATFFEDVRKDRITELEGLLADAPMLGMGGFVLKEGETLTEEELKNAFDEGVKEGSEWMTDAIEGEDKRHEAKMKELNDERTEAEEELKKSIDDLTGAVNTSNATGGLLGDDGDDGDDGDGGKDPEKTDIEMLQESLARTLGEAIGSGQLGSAKDQMKSMVGDFIGQQAAMSIGGPVGMLAGGLIKGLFGRKKKVEKPIKVEVINWGDMTQEFLKSSGRRNVSPMISTSGNYMMSANFGMEARV